MRSPAPALGLTADALAIRHMARALRFVAAGLVGAVVPGKVNLRLAEVVVVLPAVRAERQGQTSFGSRISQRSEKMVSPAMPAPMA